ncbi:MAG: ABC transporter substrate-binding protein [Marvinbryantia sp.]|uniref:ABC transporter substrate-binding protein n=1 Tax=Marvinbryantia sp. TaxID=2496532 RepID=UPI0025E12BEB|nr:extracellular solute-binding protein [uncultured Marvinbryantia sp.]
MNKKFLAMAAVASMVAAVPAVCSAEDVEINVIAAEYGQNTADWWANFVEDFNNDNAGIKLTVEVVSWNDIYTVVNTRIQGNNAPDILNIDVFADYQADGLLLPAQDYVSEETYAKMYPSFLEQSVVDDVVWAVPDLASARALYYNVDILEAAGVEVPTTWDELTAACEAIKAYDDSIYPWGIDMTTDEGQAAFAYYTWNNGGGFVDENGDWALNSDANVEAIEYAIGLVNAGYTNTDPANNTRYDLQDMFGAGQIAMVIAPNSLPTYIADGGHEVNYAVASIPCNTGESVSAGVMDRFMCFDNGYSEEELAAITTFFDYFYDDARYSDWVLMEGFLPATIAGGEAVAAADESMAAWVDIVGSSKFYPTAKAEWADVKQGVIDVEQRALLGEDVRTLLDELQADIAG